MPLFRFRLLSDPYPELTVEAEDVYAAQRDLEHMAGVFCNALVNRKPAEFQAVEMPGPRTFQIPSRF